MSPGALPFSLYSASLFKAKELLTPAENKVNGHFSGPVIVTTEMPARCEKHCTHMRQEVGSACLVCEVKAKAAAVSAKPAPTFR